MAAALRGSHNRVNELFVILDRSDLHPTSQEDLVIYATEDKEVAVTVARKVANARGTDEGLIVRRIRDKEAIKWAINAFYAYLDHAEDRE